MNILKKIVAFALMILITAFMLAGVNRTQDSLDVMIEEHHLLDTNSVENASPLVAFTTIALGSFRGLLVDYLWLRANKLQEEGQFFELRQLASWITQLQPRFTGATSHLAWNMAYNVSVTFSYPEDRWRWVQNGLELIRDEALQYNPADPKLYKELGWIYQHKVGNIMDDANLYYKASMAREMELITGSKDPEWEKLVAVPETLDDFYEKVISREELNARLAGLGVADFDTYDDNFRRQKYSGEQLEQQWGKKREDVEFFLRARWMREVQKLDPKVIVTINKEYGELDWRLPESHAIYWAWQGISYARPNSKNLIDCERMITQCLAVSFTAGRILSVEQEGSTIPLTISLPNLQVADAVKREYERAYEKRKVSTFLTARENFMVSAITQFYVFGKHEKAKEYLAILKSEFPDKKKYALDLDRFAKVEWIELVRNATPKEASSLIAGQITQSCVLLAFGDQENAVSFEKMAQFVYSFYTETQQAALTRMGLMPYTQLREQVIQNCLSAFPPKLSENLRFSIEAMKAKVQ